MNNSGIYKITNLITGDFYIGQAINLKPRWVVHLSLLSNNKHFNPHLQHAYNKYGKENFKFEIILYCEPFELTRYEQALVNKWKPNYNIRLECVDSNKGMKHTEESKLRIHVANLGNKHFLNHKHTEEYKLKMSIVKKKYWEERKQKEHELC